MTMIFQLGFPTDVYYVHLVNMLRMNSTLSTVASNAYPVPINRTVDLIIVSTVIWGHSRQCDKLFAPVVVLYVPIGHGSHLLELL